MTRDTIHYPYLPLVFTTLRTKSDSNIRSTTFSSLVIIQQCQVEIPILFMFVRRDLVRCDHQDRRTRQVLDQTQNIGPDDKTTTCCHTEITGNLYNLRKVSSTILRRRGWEVQEGSTLRTVETEAGDLETQKSTRSQMCLFVPRRS